MTEDTVSRSVALYGSEEVPPRATTLTAGPLTARLDDGALRWIRFGDAEVLRGIAFVVRDRDWGTYAPRITDPVIDQGAGAFSVRYRAVCGDAEQSLTLEAEIAASADGTLRFAVRATAGTAFVTNRTGFVVLHPIAGVAGQPVTVTQSDGTVHQARFPDRVDPVQPFTDIRALRHTVRTGLHATCTLLGDVWEMEDQRNWTDASFKTYVRPLALPKPYVLAAGQIVAQQVELRLDGMAPAAPAARDDRLSLSLGPPSGRMMPEIGLSVDADTLADAIAAAPTLRRSGIRLLGCRLDLRRPAWTALPGAFRRLAEAADADVRLEVLVPGARAPAAELAPVADALAAASLAPCSVVVSLAADLTSYGPGGQPEGAPPLDALYRAARDVFPGLPIGGGVFSFFTEFNRRPPPAALVDEIGHATTAVVHAADDRSVMETLEALPDIARSVRGRYGPRPYRLGPVSIGMPFNPYGAAVAANPGNARVPMALLDPRRRGQFAAAWALGYVARVMEVGADTLFLGAPAGPFGVLRGAAPDPAPYFAAHPDAVVYPAYHVAAGLAGAAGMAHRAATSSDPARLVGLAGQAGDRGSLWLANLTEQRVAVDLAGLPEARVAVLDAERFAAATRDPDFLTRSLPAAPGPLHLDAYAVARLDWYSGG